VLALPTVPEVAVPPGVGGSAEKLEAVAVATATDCGDDSGAAGESLLRPGAKEELPLDVDGGTGAAVPDGLPLLPKALLDVSVLVEASMAPATGAGLAEDMAPPFRSTDAELLPRSAGGPLELAPAPVPYGRALVGRGRTMAASLFTSVPGAGPSSLTLERSALAAAWAKAA